METEAKKIHPKADENEDKYRLLASMAFMIVVIIIGVPMWWKTTEVYRVGLPSADIIQLSEKPIKIGIKVKLYTTDAEKSKRILSELEALFMTNTYLNLTFQYIPPTEKTINVRTPVGLEALLLQSSPLNAGDFLFIEWPKMQEQILLTTQRTALFRPDTSASKLQIVLNSVIFQTHRLHEILSIDPQHSSKITPPQVEYDVVVSVINPQPESMDIDWNVSMAVQTYIRPFLDEISYISNYTIKTQWNYQVEFETDLKQIRDQSKIGRHYALQESSLPHIITAIEKHLSRGITEKSTINLVVYVPPCEIAPVHIYNKDGARATQYKVDSFISPKWGGVIISNPPMEVCMRHTANSRSSMIIPTNDVMQIMLSHLHKLLDIEVDYTIEGVKNEAIERLAPRLWEYDAFLRRSAVSHIVTATKTLQSLIKLLDNISYIVINDVVGAAINEAYEKICMAKEALAIGDLLMGSSYAKDAFVASEQAFFDSSLLAQLYFPDEQKYAIYIPLFLPIMVPVITSFTMTRKLLMKLRNPDKPKTD